MNNSSNERKHIKLFISIIKDALAISFWGYVIIKLFVFDIDIYVINRYFQNYAWIISYKFFIIIGTLAVVWLITKNQQIYLWILYILFYPLIFFLWKIPLFIFKKKSWNLAFAYIDSIISFFKSVKISFITISFFLVSVAIVLSSFSQILLWFSIIILLGLLLYVYLQRIILIVKPSGIYQVYTRFFSYTGDFLQDYKSPLGALSDEEVKQPIEQLEEKQIKLWTSEVQLLVSYNRICLFMARKLKSYQNSGFNTITLVISILLLVLYTIFSFAVINFALYKINSHFYSYPTQPSFFSFFYYSFNALLFNQIQDLLAIEAAAQTVLMVEYFFAFFIVAIFVTLVLSVRQQKNIDELNETIAILKQVGEKVERFISDKYNLSNIDVALAALEKLKASMMSFLDDITEALE